MIQNLEIQNFKSIKDLKLPCKKVNIFIGEPNAGKTNIIEALSLLAIGPHAKFRDLIRASNLSEIFFDSNTESSLKISIDESAVRLVFDPLNHAYQVIYNGKKGQVIHEVDLIGDHFPNLSKSFDSKFKPYKFNGVIGRQRIGGSLNWPFGDNLGGIIVSNKEFRAKVTEVFKSKGFKVSISPVEVDIRLSKEVGDEIFFYPYNSISETLRRMVFLMACLETNTNSVILFDEPEANLFPFYTKYFAERLAYDETNQFFFTTHNPYLIEAIVAKTKPEDLNVIVTYMKDYETKIKILSEQEILDAVDSDIFFNLKLFTEPA